MMLTLEFVPDMAATLFGLMVFCVVLVEWLLLDYWEGSEPFESQVVPLLLT